MSVEYAFTAVAVLVAAVAMRRLFRLQHPDDIDCGQVSGHWLNEHKMSKNNPNWP